MLQTPTISRQFIAPLENGDQLSRDEFERRYAAMPETCKAELIEGIVCMSAAALRFKSHGQPHSFMNAWLATYQAFTAFTMVADAPTVRLDPINEPQPDLALVIDSDAGGQTQLSEDDYLEGSPELLAEIAASTVSIDLGTKKIAYERNGVKEYLVWRVLDQQIDWFYLQNGKYVHLQPDEDGITRSQVFPGLWLHSSALIQGDMKQVLAILQAGIASQAHDEFVTRLEMLRRS